MGSDFFSSLVYFLLHVFSTFKRKNYPSRSLTVFLSCSSKMILQFAAVQKQSTVEKVDEVKLRQSVKKEYKKHTLLQHLSSDRL